MKQRNVITQKIVGIFLLVGLLLTFATPAFAEGEAGINKFSPHCPEQPMSADLQSIAQSLITGNELANAKKCYKLLTLEERAIVFEFIVKLQGGSIELVEKDAANMRISQISTKDTQPNWGGAWSQLIERSWGTFHPVVSTSYYYPNQTFCDNDPSDTDYIFVYYFPTSIFDPDSLRVISADPLVDAMLAYYQWKYGGLKGFGLISTPKVSICVGDTGVQYGGGVEHISAHMKMHQ